MPIPFTCPHCGVHTSVDERYAGQSGPCHQCGKPVTVPVPWTPTMAPPASGSGSSGIIVAAVVVVGIVAALFCSGVFVFMFAVRSTALPPRPMPYPVQTTAAPWGVEFSPDEFDCPPTPVDIETRPIIGDAWEEDVPRNVAPPPKRSFQGPGELAP